MFPKVGPLKVNSIINKLYKRKRNQFLSGVAAHLPYLQLPTPLNIWDQMKDLSH